MRKLILTLFIAFVIFVGVVQAQEEDPPLFSCIYECKVGVARLGLATPWSEVTTLVLVNQNNDYVWADLLFFDGNEKAIARTETELSRFDLDEINVCETLNLGGVKVVPPAGMVQVRLKVQDPDDRFRVTVWIKNLLGRFTKGVKEPFAGTVTGIAKTRCDRMMVLGFLDPNVPNIDPILIEDTYEKEGPIDGEKN